jgi:hypothetical protein
METPNVRGVFAGLKDPPPSPSPHLLKTSDPYKNLANMKTVLIKCSITVFDVSKVVLKNDVFS